MDFHALRSTLSSNLAAADVHPRTAQELLRHSTIDLTMFPGTRGAQFSVTNLQVQFDNQPQTIQIPVFQLAQVRTTVSVPDGGTLLLGGFKTSPDGERQIGLPILNKIPILNRAFRSQAFLQENRTLLMLVTPRIIIDP